MWCEMQRLNSFENSTYAMVIKILKSTSWYFVLHVLQSYIIFFVGFKLKNKTEMDKYKIDT